MSSGLPIGRVLLKATGPRIKERPSESRSLRGLFKSAMHKYVLLRFSSAKCTKADSGSKAAVYCGNKWHLLDGLMAVRLFQFIAAENGIYSV